MWTTGKKKPYTSLCSPQSIAQHCWCQFSKCSANKILHPLHLWGLRILWSLTTRFTSLLKYSLKKLYKHSYTIEMEVLRNGHPSCYGPNVTIFTALNLNTFTPQPCTQANASYTVITTWTASWQCCTLGLIPDWSVKQFIDVMQISEGPVLWIIHFTIIF